MQESNLTNLTRAFLGDEINWEYARIILRDVHGLWGGRNIFIEGSGYVLLQRVSPAQEELRYEFELSHGLINFQRHSFQLSKPAEVEHAGFSAIHDELLRIEASAQLLEPIYYGPYAGEPS